MTQKIDLNGKEFISAKEAAVLTGYTSDYVGQLCRGGKVESKMVGRTWFVVRDSILKHKENGLNSSPAKSSRNSESKKTGLTSQSVDDRAFSAKSSSAQKINQPFTYERDDSPLRPELKKRPTSLRSAIPKESKNRKQKFPPKVKPRTYLSSVKVASINPDLLHKIGTLALSAAMVFGTFFLAQNDYARIFFKSFFSNFVEGLDYGISVIFEVPSATIHVAQKTPIYLKEGASDVSTQLANFSEKFGSIVYSSTESSKEVLSEFYRNPGGFLASVGSIYSSNLSEIRSDSDVANLNSETTEAPAKNYFSQLKNEIDILALAVYDNVNVFFAKRLEGVEKFGQMVFGKTFVGTSQYASGITLYDTATNAPYCLIVEDGVPKSMPGDCYLKARVVPVK